MVVSSQTKKSLQIIFKDEQFKQSETVSKLCLLPNAQNEIHNLVVKSARLLTNGDDVKRVIELTMDNSDNLINFSPGDTIGIIPENDTFEVSALLDRLGVNQYADTLYTLSPDDINLPKHVPKTGSIRYLFQHFVDIRRFLSKKLISILAEHTKDENERIYIQRLSKESKLYMELIVEKYLSILEFLNKFSSCQPPVAILIENLPKIVPRPYSICSSHKVNGNEIKICFSVESFHENKMGLTTGWLDKKLENVFINDNQTNQSNVNSIINNFADMAILKKHMDKKIYVPAYLRPSTFSFPTEKSVPIIMICNGTGIAPFISFIEEREYIMSTSCNGDFGSVWLYYGCKFETADFLYKDKINQLAQNGVISKLNVALSRNTTGTPKYVQEHLYADKDAIIEIFNTSAVIYVCGSNNMVKQVELFLYDTLIAKNVTTDKEAKNEMKRLKDNRKIVLDVWT